MGKQNRFITFVVSICFFLSTFNSPVFASYWTNNTSNGVTAIGLGLLDRVEVGAPEGDYFGIGTVQIDWRDLEPEEGKFNWGLLKPGWEMVPNAGGFLDTSVSPPILKFSYWGGYYTKHLCELGKFPCGDNGNGFIIPQPVPGYQILAAMNRGKKVRFKIGVTDGALPLWMIGGDTLKPQGAKETALGLGPHGNGIYDSFPNTTLCAYKTQQQADLNTPDCHPDTDLSTAVTYPSYPYKEGETQPVWWNPIFQEKYKNMLKKVAEKVESDPDLLKAIDFVEATVGNFGEMILYGKDETSWAICNNNPILNNGPEECWCTQKARNEGKCSQADVNTPTHINHTNYFCSYAYRKPEANHAPGGVNLWLKAGYTNKKYYDAVMGILTASEDYFQKIPTAISKGSGLYPGDPLLFRSDCTPIATDDIDHYPYRMNTWVIPDAIERWGARLYLKFAGFPEGEVTTFQTNCPSKTKCIYESFGSVSAWNIEDTTFPFKKTGETDADAESRFGRALYRANQGHASVLMMWSSDFNLIYNPANSYLVPPLAGVGTGYLGPQISLGSNFIILSSNSVHAGSNLGITTSWSNRSYVSLWRTKRVPSIGVQHGQTFSTTKDLVVSNPIYIDLVNGSNQIVYKTTYIPTNGTQNWILANGTAGIFESNDQVFIPWSVSPGTYTLRIGLPINDTLTKFWRFNELTETNIDGVYTTGKTITVTAPTTTGVSFKPGWNFVHWPSGVQLSDNQISEIWSACSMKSQVSYKNTIITDFSVLPTTLISGTSYFFNCQKALW